ncbi:hypothetical protein Amet_0844 [Alkaliphilus metalliredigens QYMF]|uniref:CD-NTase associated protein 4-like DNA endonuclease domain-containing protein n=1 Tax=Alkaliphilus metalliredigens (strain QYMF) TaxID=293826 RepID=A6TLK1_ALKMQ|nr:hypothetical protein [Alkaliphilus metalliredigens]ABR47069.1 hypothetical protein Amet_0844 [Alkaliphilus metalliredigens QYMF]
MINESFNTNIIDSNADSPIRGIVLQKLRAFNKLLDALSEKNFGIMCAIEYIDDVIEVDSSEQRTKITAEQDKLNVKSFSMNSHQVINSIRIFFDNWREKTMNSESIKFVFYTNTVIAKERMTALLTENSVKLPERPILKLLIEKEYDKALPVFKIIFKDYYISQHEQNLKKEEKEKIEIFQQIINQVTDEEWKLFLNLIDWNFEQEDEKILIASVKDKIGKLCDEYDVKLRYIDSIFNEIMSMIEMGTFQDDFLNKVVHVAQLKVLFLEKARIVQSEEYLDPAHQKWDDICCEDIRNLKEKVESVCNQYGEDIEDLQDDYVEGAYEQEHHNNLKAVKAFKYRIYKLCEREIRKAMKVSDTTDMSKIQIDNFVSTMTDKCETLISDKAKTYNTIPFKDRDMIRKTILILFEECYLAFDKGGTVNG